MQPKNDGKENVSKSLGEQIRKEFFTKKFVNYLLFVALFLLPLLFYPVVHTSGWISSSDIHASLEFAASLLAVTAGIMVLLHFFTTGKWFYLMISSGFIIIGTEEFVHAIFAFNRIWVETIPTFKFAISSTWLTGRFILATSFFIALIFGDREIVTAKKGLSAIGYNIIGFVFAATITLLIFNLPHLPSFVQLGSITKRLIELSLALLFFVTFLLYSKVYLKQQSRNRFFLSIIACILFQVLAQIFVFDSRNFYDSQWDIAHLIVFLSYFFPIFGVWSETIKLHKSAQAQVIELAKEMAERKRMDDALRESEERYRKAQEVGHVGSWEYDIKNNTFWASDEGKRIYGFNLETDIFTAEEVMKCVIDRDSVDQALVDLIEINEPYNIVFDIIPRNASEKRTINSIAELVRDENGNPIKVIGVMQDITELKKSEDELKKSQVLLKSSIQSQKDTILFSIDQNYRYLYFNKAHMDVMKYAYNTDIKIGMNILECITTDDDRIAAKENYDRALMGESHTNIRVFGDVNLDYYESFFNPIVNDNNEIIGATGLARNITERKRAEEELIIAKEKAEENDQLKSAFLANMSHEIRTPMNGILGFAELLKKPNLTGEEQQKYIRIIEKSSGRMLNIINDIIDISKIESGQMEVIISDTSINEQIEYIYAFFKPNIEQKGIQFSFKNSLPAKEAIIKTDREKIYAILTNLVKNAIKFTHAGSIEFGYEKKGKYLEFFVKDTGSGVSEQQQEIIFERFRQGNDLITEFTEGTGLGLSISKAYVEILGGKIWVESDPEGKSGEKGSIFYFTIPYNAEPDSKTVIKNVISADEEENQINNLKILIAEDDETSEMIITMAVKMFSKEILKTKTGDGAVEACRNNPDIDLVLMDIKMPDMNGYEATRQIRQFNKDVVIISQTALGLTGDREKAMKAGCNDYISKPFVIEELKELIRKHFSKSVKNKLTIY